MLLSTPFWEFQGSSKARVLCQGYFNFLLPFGSFRRKKKNRFSLLSPLAAFYSLLGVSQWWDARLRDETMGETLSTPFWEFHGHSHIMQNIKLYRYHNFLLPFGSFKVYCLHKVIVMIESLAFLLPFGSFGTRGETGRGRGRGRW